MYSLTPMHPIRRYCEKHGLRQAHFADRCGLSKPYISQIINGRQKVGANAARDIVAASGGEITFEELLTWKPEVAA